MVSDLLPVVASPHAVISPKSKIKEKGKLPSIYNIDREVVGITGWTSAKSTEREVSRWAQDPDLGICIQSRLWRAIDIDIASPEKAAEIQAMVEISCGRMHLRGRENSGKRLLVFRHEGELPKRVIRTSDGVIELLGNGQQFVAVSTHPSGARYTWPEGLPGEHFPVAEMSLDEIDTLWHDLMTMFGIEQSEQRAGARPTVPRSAEQRHGDPLVAFLQEHGWVQDGGYAPDGRVDVRCPWSSAHTVDSGITSSSYFPKMLAVFPAVHIAACMAIVLTRT